jgi:hypothetical protein
MLTMYMLCDTLHPHIELDKDKKYTYTAALCLSSRWKFDTTSVVSYFEALPIAHAFKAKTKQKKAAAF